MEFDKGWFEIAKSWADFLKKKNYSLTAIRCSLPLNRKSSKATTTTHLLTKK